MERPRGTANPNPQSLLNSTETKAALFASEIRSLKSNPGSIGTQRVCDANPSPKPLIAYKVRPKIAESPPERTLGMQLEMWDARNVGIILTLD